MASLTRAQYPMLWTNGGGEPNAFVLYAVKNVTTGDTMDVSADFRVILQSVWMGATVSGTVAGTNTGTVLTAPNGLASAGAYVLVQGVAL